MTGRQRARRQFDQAGRIVLGALVVTALVGCSEGAPVTTVTANGSPGPVVTFINTSAPISGQLIAGQVELEDAKGDLVDEDGRTSARNPHVDVRRVSASADGTHLWVSVDVGGTIPASISTTRQLLNYLLIIEADRSGEFDYWVAVENRENGSWVGNLTDWATSQTYAEENFPGVVSVSDNTVSFRISLTALGSPSSVRIGVVTQRAENSDGSVLAQDEVPAGSFDFKPTKTWLRLGS